MYEFLFGTDLYFLFIAPAIIAAGIGAVAGGAQSAFTGKMNKKSRNFQREMFDKTNAYNSPLEQRKRLEAAGLNPNLVYGSSSGGVAGTASQPSKPDFNTPEISGIAAPIQKGVMDYYNSKNIQSATDVNDAREENIKQDTVNKGIDSVNKAISAASGQIDYKTKKELYSNTIAKAQESLRNLSVNTDYTAAKNSREQQIINDTQNKLKQAISNLKTQGKILKDEAIMKKIDQEMQSQYGMRPSDPHYYRVIKQVFEGIMDATGLDNYKNKF